MSDNTTLPMEKAQAIKQRDHQQCQNCRRPVGQAGELRVYQIVPGEHGGSERLSNYTTLCGRCYRQAENA